MLFDGIKKDVRYFFAYHLTNGIPFAFKWAEWGGLPVGGIPQTVPGTIVEITEQEFTEPGISELEKEYPFPVLTEATPPPDVNSS